MLEFPWEGVHLRKSAKICVLGYLCHLRSVTLSSPWKKSPPYKTHLFSRARKEGFSFFFLWGDTVQNCPQNPAPAGCLFSTRKSRSEVPERGDFGEEKCLGKAGADRAKKGKKDAQKKVGKVGRDRNPSCTRLRALPVALHVSRYTCRSWFPGFYSVLQV